MNQTLHPLDKLKEPLTEEMFRLNVQKTFESGHFNICGVRDAIQLINPMGAAILDEVRAMHCINWSEMSPQMMAHIVDTVARAMVFTPALLSLNEIDPEVNEAKTILRDILRPRRQKMEEKVSNAVDSATVVDGEVVTEGKTKGFLKLLSFSK